MATWNVSRKVLPKSTESPVQPKVRHSETNTRRTFPNWTSSRIPAQFDFSHHRRHCDAGFSLKGLQGEIAFKKQNSVIVATRCGAANCIGLTKKEKALLRVRLQQWAHGEVVFVRVFQWLVLTCTWCCMGWCTVMCDPSSSVLLLCHRISTACVFVLALQFR